MCKRPHWRPRPHTNDVGDDSSALTDDLVDTCLYVDAHRTALCNDTFDLKGLNVSPPRTSSTTATTNKSLVDCLIMGQRTSTLTGAILPLTHSQTSPQTVSQAIASIDFVLTYV